MKRLFDIVFSAFGILLLMPVFIVAAIMIKAEDGGLLFYRGVRVGRHFKPFRIFKFRTMVVNADKIGGPSTSDNDPRLTKAGRLLRKYKIDELPQMVNVLKGEMSFVGPRPEVPMEVETYDIEERKILSVRPGITDWASIVFHNEGAILSGSADPHQAYREKIKPEKLRLALKYVDEKSFLTDIRIIFETILTLVKTRS
jgi:lipopolysaccharide/colanic/teichoic acid biosynthesis glycosyltransferase